MHSHYHKQEKYRRKEEPGKYTYLCERHEILQGYLSQTQRRASGFGHYVITNINPKVSKNDIILADMLCYVIGELFDYRGTWFPWCYVYKDEMEGFDFFNRLDSKRHFEKVKGIFNVQTPQELIDLVNDYKKGNENLQPLRFSSYTHVPFVYETINVDKIAINR